MVTHLRVILFWELKHHYRSPITLSHNLPQREMLKRLQYGHIIEKYQRTVAEDVRRYYENYHKNHIKDEGLQSNEYREMSFITSQTCCECAILAEERMQERISIMEETIELRNKTIIALINEISMKNKTIIALQNETSNSNEEERAEIIE